MSYGSISAKQQEILDFIKSEILNKGYPPSVRDIGEAVHLKSTSSVHAHLETLEKNGYIRRDPTKPRTIEIVDDSFNLTRREVVNGKREAGGVTGRAHSALGTPYVPGGRNPGGFDCSGLVQWAYKGAGVNRKMTSWIRSSSTGMCRSSAASSA